MQRVAFKMKLLKGEEQEYQRRHDALWPELQTLLKQKGIKAYSIFLEEATNDLFGYLTVEDTAILDGLAGEAIMKKWWGYMKDIMETHEDNSPVAIPLKEVFYLP